MRILHAILSREFFGSERYCIELATGQARAGNDVAVLIQDRESNCARAFRREAEVTSAAIAQQKGPGSIRIVAIPRWVPALLHRPLAWWILRKCTPDIVHTHLNPAARRVGRVGQSLRVPHVATLHIRYEPREHGACDGVICIASWQRAAIPEGFGGEAAVVRPWISASIHTALAGITPEKVTSLRSRWTADDRTVVFGSIGRFVPEKGMDLLIRSFRAAFPHADELVRLVVLGTGPQLEELNRLAVGDDRITLMSTQFEIAPFYRAFDIYVSAARFEPFGLTILEAMDAACSLVVARTDGPREFLENMPVLWAEPDDETSLAGQLRVAAARGRMPVDFDRSMFSQTNAVAAIGQFYERVLARRSSAGRKA